jgi:hypothetical protein
MSVNLTFTKPQLEAIIGAVEQMETEFGFYVRECEGCREWEEDFFASHTPACYRKAQKDGGALLAYLHEALKLANERGFIEKLGPSSFTVICPKTKNSLECDCASVMCQGVDPFRVDL